MSRDFSCLATTLRTAGSALKPVLAQLKDNALYLRHNLNAAVIGSLKSKVTKIQRQIEQRFSRINARIAESDSFIISSPRQAGRRPQTVPNPALWPQ